MFKRLAIICLLVLGLQACSVAKNPDPFEKYNRVVFDFNNQLDQHVIAPIADGYKTYTPRLVRDGIGNFFNNLDDVIVVGNDILQLKPANTLHDLSRLTINSTVGLLGLIDVATSLGISKRNEDFGQTLGRWGVPAGPYLVLPIVGPRTLRSTAGLALDTEYLDPKFRWWHEPEIQYGLTSLYFIDVRSRLGGTLDSLNNSLDPYTYIRDAFIQRREILVHDGVGQPSQAIPDDIEELIDDDEGDEALYLE